MVVSTKGGNHADFDGLSAATVAGAVEASLRRLDTDYIDVYFAHYQDDLTPIEESAAAFDDLVTAGKIRAVGLSNFTAAAVSEWIDTALAGGLAAPVVLQPHYSLVQRQPFEASWPPWRATPVSRCFPTGPWAADSSRASTAPCPTPRTVPEVPGYDRCSPPRDFTCSTPSTRSPAATRLRPPPSPWPGCSTNRGSRPR